MKLGVMHAVVKRVCLLCSALYWLAGTAFKLERLHIFDFLSYSGKEGWEMEREASHCLAPLELTVTFMVILKTLSSGTQYPLPNREGQWMSLYLAL